MKKKKKESRDIQICQRECFARNNQKIKTFLFGKCQNKKKKKSTEIMKRKWKWKFFLIKDIKEWIQIGRKEKKNGGGEKGCGTRKWLVTNRISGIGRESQNRVEAVNKEREDEREDNSQWK